MRATKLIKVLTVNIFLLFVVMMPKLAMAQIDDLPCGGYDPYGTDCPIDSWLSILVAIGVIFGVYSINKTKSKLKKIPYQKIQEFKNSAL